MQSVGKTAFCQDAQRIFCRNQLPLHQPSRHYRRQDGQTHHLPFPPNTLRVVLPKSNTARHFLRHRSAENLVSFYPYCFALLSEFLNQESSFNPSCFSLFFPFYNCT